MSAKAYIFPSPIARGWYQIEWRGEAGAERAGVTYPSTDRALRMATTCGASMEDIILTREELP
jgi:hypothetical protein